jgi:hypothetical protein
MRKPKNREENLIGFGEELLIEDASSTSAGIVFGLGDIPRGPEPGPLMPKRKRPQIY